MNEPTLYIDKERVLPDSEDYNYLRSEGLNYIQELANKIWTDYNIHDPGITVLESLCYAITDLGYRTNYFMKDILAEGNTSGKKPPKQFFTAREILTCNPVTINDYRKVLIDIDGVRNGWLEIEDKVEPQLYVDCPNSRLTLDANVKNEKPVDLRGLYNVILELDEDDEAGDLNIYCFERTVSLNNKDIDFEISLPSWDSYFGLNKIPKEFYFSDLSSSTDTNEYKGIMTAYFHSGSKLFDFKVKVIGTKSESLKNTIEKELKRKDKNSLEVHYLEMIKKACAIAQNAYEVLHSKRNLCEDFYKFKAVDIEEVMICADIEVTAQADPSEVLANIYYQVSKFISPPVNFYSIKEMYGKEKTTDEIFEGPVLNYGFIDDDELDDSEFKTVIHVSDIIQIIMDVPEVVAVKSIMLSSYYKCDLLTDSEKWCLKIGGGHAPRFNADKSKIVFYKGFIPLSADKNETAANLKEFELLDRPKRLSKDEYDLSLPTGTNKNIQNYYSIQNDYPLCYAIGEEGFALSAEAKRKAQAKQFKGFLLFFDQLLADYLAQLAHVKHLFSINPKIKRTYFSHNLIANEENNQTDIPNAQNLFKQFVDTLDFDNDDLNIDDFSTFEVEWNAFVSDPQNNPPVFERNDMQETVSVFEDRRNRFLDHLMARFAEQFSDYVALMYLLDRMKAPEELIEDKISFLKDYPEISSGRSKAFNYKDHNDVWDTDNVSGLEKRVSKLLGIKSFKRKNLAEYLESSFEFYQEKDKDGVDEFRFRMVDLDGNILLSSSTKYYSMADAMKEKNSVIDHGLYKDNYEIKKSKKNTFYINLTDGSGNIIARMIRYFKKQEDAEAEVEKIFGYMVNASLESEGFHLIEHILLRPKLANDKLLTVCVNKNCTNCLGFIDPYSFRITVIVPYWPRRFKNMDFRKFFETTVRMEAPAHVHVKICWVEEDPMKNFEKYYLIWLKEISKEIPDPVHLSKKQKDLIEALESLRSVYPETRLYDCGADDQTNAILLNHSILGSTKEEENDEM